MYQLITVCGIGEVASANGAPAPGTMLKLFTDAVMQCPGATNIWAPPKQFNWQNTYGPIPITNGAAYATNVVNAAASVDAAVTASPIRVVLCGYSGGADVVSRAAAMSNPNLAGVVVAANPRRASGDSLSPNYGIAGAHDGWTVPYWDLANPLDVIPCCPGPDTYPLREFEDITSHFSLADPQRWGNMLYQAVLDGETNPAFRNCDLMTFWQVLAYVRGYLFDHQHNGPFYKTGLPNLAPTVHRYFASL